MQRWRWEIMCGSLLAEPSVGGLYGTFHRQATLAANSHAHLGVRPLTATTARWRHGPSAGNGRREEDDDRIADADLLAEPRGSRAVPVRRRRPRPGERTPLRGLSGSVDVRGPCARQRVAGFGPSPPGRITAVLSTVRLAACPLVRIHRRVAVQPTPAAGEHAVVPAGRVARRMHFAPRERRTQRPLRLRREPVRPRWRDPVHVKRSAVPQPRARQAEELPRDQVRRHPRAVRERVQQDRVVVLRLSE